jgi:predicted TPR repeat methyltransferase
MEEKYINGKYWEENETLHEEDSDFKSEHFLTLLKRNPLIPTKKIVDIGCGAGRIIWNFSKEYPESSCVGVDLSEKIIEYAKGKYSSQHLKYLTHDEFEKNEEIFELVLLADVFEHVRDYLGFLKDIRSKYPYQLFNIPLDLSVKYLLNDRPMKMKDSVGHLHYFYDKLILKILEDNGFKVIDYLYANNLEVELEKKIGFSKYKHLVKKYILKALVRIFGESLVSRIYGGFSLTVLTTGEKE